MLSSWLQSVIGSDMKPGEGEQGRVVKWRGPTPVYPPRSAPPLPVLASGTGVPPVDVLGLQGHLLPWEGGEGRRRLPVPG